MTKTGHQKILRTEGNFFGNLWKNVWAGNVAAADISGLAVRRCRPKKLTDAPPPIQWRRRTALFWI